MTGKNGNGKNKGASAPGKEMEASAKVAQTEQNVASTSKTDKSKQTREKAKGKKQNGFVAFVKKADPIAMACFVAIILASCVVIGAYINDEYIKSDSPAIAQVGSTVEVDYVGSYLSYYDEAGSVIFDTNIENVAKDNSRTFSVGFTQRDSYSALSFQLGGDSVIKAFGDACIGKKVGDVVRVAVPAEDGYGSTDRYSNATKIVSIPLNGTTTLAKFNEICGTKLTASDFPCATASIVSGVDMYASINGDKVDYSIINDSATGPFILSSGLTASSVVKNGTDLEVTFDLTSTGVYKAFDMVDGELTPVYVEYVAGEAGYYYWVNDLSSHAEQKGEKMYFYIKLTSVKNA